MMVIDALQMLKIIPASDAAMKLKIIPASDAAMKLSINHSAASTGAHLTHHDRRHLPTEVCDSNSKSAAVAASVQVQH